MKSGRKVHKEWRKSPKNVPKEPKILHKFKYQVKGFPKVYDTKVVRPTYMIPLILPPFRGVRRGGVFCKDSLSDSWGQGLSQNI